jgi:microcystin-dependent protein
LCNGQLLSIQSYSALYSLLGTTFGGDGRTTFALPDLQGRIPLGVSVPTYPWGQKAGAAQLPITISNMPMHTHQAIFAGTAPATPPAVTVNVQGSSAVGGTNDGVYVTSPASGTLGNIAGVSGSIPSLPAPVGTVTNAMTGNGVPLNIEPPYLAVYFIICNSGVYPTRE